MDQSTVESLLRRLVERVEESERRYSEALDELHARLDQISQTTGAARETGSPEDAATLDRLHTQVSSLARRLGQDAETSLDDFERLGKALSRATELAAEGTDEPSPAAEAPKAPASVTTESPEAGAESSANRGAPGYDVFYAAPESEPPLLSPPQSSSSPFAGELSVFDTPETFSSAPASEPAVQAAPEPSYSLAPHEPQAFAPAEHAYSTPELEGSHLSSDTEDFDKRLLAMAHEFEHTIGAAMPASTVEALHARLDEIDLQLAQALAQDSKRERLEHVEKQLSEMGQQLGRAEVQLAKMSSIESQLLTLIGRFDASKAQFEPAELEPGRLDEIAKRAATEAARLVAKEPMPGTAERLEAMHRDLMAMSDRSRDSDDRLAKTLNAVHESLKQLVQQAERGAPLFQPKPRAPFAERARQATEPVTPTPAQGPVPPPQGPLAEVRIEKGPEPSFGSAIGGNGTPAKERPPRSRLGAAIPDFQDTEPAPPFGRAKRGLFEEEAVDLDASTGRRARLIPGHDAEPEAPDDLVATARRVAQAVARKAEERNAPAKGRRSPPVLAGDAPAGAEAASRRKRSVLIIAAAILLAISAALLYGRLKSKPEGEIAPPAAEQSVPSPSDSPSPSGSDATTPAPSESAPADQPAKSGAWEILPGPEEKPADKAAGDASEESPADNAASQGDQTTGVTDIAKTSPSLSVAPAAELAPEPQPAALKSESVALPPGVIFTVEDPTAPSLSAPAPEAQKEAPSLPAASSLPLPPAELGALALRQAAATGDARAQYAIAIRYAEGKGTARNLTEAVRWFESAANAGLAPAQYRLGVMYERGQGTEADPAKAQAWYMAAAKQGNVKAMHNLAVSLGASNSDKPDYAIAAKWYEEAASYGLADSQFNLGILAEEGLGRAKDLVAAYKWFALAAANGDQDAAKRRELVEVQLDAASLAEAEQAIKAWKAKDAIAEANEVGEPAEWAETAPAPNAALVTRAQSLLNKLGYDVGPPDGVAGERTRAAIKSFERRNGLEESGEITVPLVTKLERLTS